jgi:molybdopterin adenylyltransferase
VSDRASRGEYEDKGGPAAEDWLRRVLSGPVEIRRVIIPDGRASVAETFRQLADEAGADLILATGGTGPAPRDETPEAMAEVIEKDLPGFGELMRQVSLREVPTAILSRQGAGVRGRCLIVTLPGKPSAIATCLEAVFPAIPYCLDLIGAARIETDPEVLVAFRPKGA